MPAYYEMLVSQSPPVYGKSPLSDYNNIQFSRQARNFCRTASLQLTPPSVRRQISAPQLKVQTSPKRSCLVVRSDSTDSADSTPEEEKEFCFTTQNTIVKPHKKKHVVFADDKGYELTQVRVMQEPSCMPPIWSLQFLAHVTQGLISPVPPEQWIVDFRQPASDYLQFRQKLDENMVSLENVIIKEAESTVVGTVKVRNLDFQKEVIIRSSCDSWRSQEDTYCTYSKLGTSNLAYVLYDTFSFKLTLPPTSRKLEFCVCFRCNGVEYWDNNQDKNYSLSNRLSPRPETNEILVRVQQKRNATNNQNGKVQPKFKEAPHAKLDTWSEFAAWEHLENNAPYWSNGINKNSNNTLHHAASVPSYRGKSSNDTSLDVDDDDDEDDGNSIFSLIDIKKLMTKINSRA